MPPLSAIANDKREHSSPELAAARAAQIHCQHCSLSGLVTIYRTRTPDCDGYTGKPTAQLADHNGELITVRARVACHCSCKVGEWMRNQTGGATCKRIPELRFVGIKGYGMENWTSHDPTLPEYDRNAIPDWSAFRRMVAGAGSVVTKVYPEYDGSRAAAYREMGEGDPARRERPIIVPDDPGDALEPASAGLDDEPPF